MHGSTPVIGDAGLASDGEADRSAFRRPDLHWPGWVFVMGAALVVLVRLVRVADEPSTMVAQSAVPSAIAAGLGALLPAALLLRVPEASRTHRLLLIGLAGEALAEWAWVILPGLPIGSDSSAWTTSAVFVALYGVQFVAALCVGLGLLRLRARRPTRAWLLVAIVAGDLAFLGLQVGLAAAHAQVSVVSRALVPILLVTVGAGFAVWVPVSAWLDGDQPRAFWGLLALGFPLGLLGSTFGFAQTLAMLTPAPSGFASDAAFLVPTAMGALVGSVSTLLALTAYARWTPPSRGASRVGDEAVRSA